VEEVAGEGEKTEMRWGRRERRERCGVPVWIRLNFFYKLVG
jgi:hypothetical protein